MVGFDAVWAMAERSGRLAGAPLPPDHLIVVAANEPDELYNGLIATRLAGCPLFLRLAEQLLVDLATPADAPYGANTRRLFAEMRTRLAAHLPATSAAGIVFEDYTQKGDVFFLREWRVSDDGWGRYVIKAAVDAPVVYGNGNRDWPPRVGGNRDDRMLLFA
jgi:hypothetical protein